MIGLALGAATILPTVAQAQDRGRDIGALMNGNSETRRQAMQQARQANRAVERPAPMPPRASAAPNSGGRASGGDRSWNRGDAATMPQRDRNRGGDAAAQPQRTWNRGGASVGTPQPGQERPVPAVVAGNGDTRQRSWDRGGNRNDRIDPSNRVDRSDRDRNRDRDRDGVGNDRGNDRNQRWSSDRRDWNRDGQGVNRDTRGWDRNDRNDRNWNRDRDNRNWGDRNGRGNDRWNSNWRNDRRYDWRSYRSHNRGIYRLPRYAAPRGYSYQRWYPGYRWNSFFYSSSYWISDPWSYRLPPAYGDYRWVRYYDDAVLVDLRSGEIVDIIYSFFF